MNDDVSAVILNWKRPANVIRIVSALQQTSLVSEVIVWNNNPAAPFHHAGAKIVNACQDLGLYTRFAAACLVQNEAVLIQDDDLELPAESLGRLYEAWRAEPDVIHGIFGRKPRSDGSYAVNIRGNADSPIVLTRALIVHRRYAAEFFRVAPRFSELQRRGLPVGNGEDIIFSYMVRHQSGRMNRTHDVPVIDLPAPHPIHGRDSRAHVAHRTRLLRACEAWLQEERTKSDLADSQVSGKALAAGKSTPRCSVQNPRLAPCGSP